MKFEYMTPYNSGDTWEWETENNSHIMGDELGNYYYMSLVEALNILGENGWEAVCKDNEYKWVLKRKYEDE